MNTINIGVSSKANVYESSNELALGLRSNSLSTKKFRESINEFLDNFNNRYNTAVTFEQVLDIYEQKSDLEVDQSIILCKALLDFIQNNGIEVSFQGKSCLLKYSTLGNVNASLEFNPLSEDLSEREMLNTLSVTISSFIQNIKNYFRIFIKDSESLGDVNIDSRFKEIPGVSFQTGTAKIVDKENGGKKDVKISNGSITITEGLTLQFNIPDEKFIEKIASLNHMQFAAFLNCIHERLDSTQIKGIKHVDIARVIFKDYKPHYGAAVKNVFKKLGTLNRASIEKFDFESIRKIIFTDLVLVEEEDTGINGDDDAPDEGTEGDDKNANDKIELKGNILFLTPEISIDFGLEDDLFIDSITDLSKEDVQKFFGYLENLLLNNGVTQRLVAQSLADIIKKSDNKKLNVAQKITSLRNKDKPSKIYKKFLENNINISNLKSFVLSGGSFQIDDSGEKPKKYFEFKCFNLEDWMDDLTINVEYNGIKNLNGFVCSLNSLIFNYCKQVDLEGYIETPFTVDDFNGIELNSAFIDNLSRLTGVNNSHYIFDIFEKKTLFNFLEAWHNATGKKLKKAKKVFIETGSKEELMDFVAKLQEEVDGKIHTINRKSHKRNYKLGSKLREVKITEEMLIGIDKLTPQFVNKLSGKAFEKIFSIYSRSKIQALLDEYIKERKMS